MILTQVMMYLDLLPDELFRKVYEYVYSQALYDIEGGCGQIPLDMYYIFCPENSDYVRAEYLKRTYLTKRILNPPGYGYENDYWKLLIDLERPTIYCSPLCSWKHYYVRRWEVMRDGYLKGGLYWNSSFESAMLTLAGWARLTDKEE